MTALADSQARIGGIRKLRTVVAAMRGIAATHTQQARGALGGYRAYAKVIADGLSRAVSALERRDLAIAAPRADGAATVVFTAEHGFAGAFTERLLDALGETRGTTLFLVGARGLALANQRGLHAEWTGPMASQAAGVDATARAVADALYAGFIAERFARAEIVFARFSPGAGPMVVRRPILPIDLSAFQSRSSGPPPLFNLSPRRLIEQLVGEYVFAELALAALESFASENETRLATMESARMNIEDKLEELSGQERLLRQEQITAEVLELSSGALAGSDRQWKLRPPSTASAAPVT